MLFLKSGYKNTFSSNRTKHYIYMIDSHIDFVFFDWPSYAALYPLTWQQSQLSAPQWGLSMRCPYCASSCIDNPSLSPGCTSYHWILMIPVLCDTINKYRMKKYIYINISNKLCINDQFWMYVASFTCSFYLIYNFFFQIIQKKILHSLLEFSTALDFRHNLYTPLNK